MNDEAKEILIDIIEYQNAVGTKKDLGSLTLERLAQRAQKALDNYSRTKNTPSTGVDPFQVEFDQYEFEFKDEAEW